MIDRITLELEGLMLDRLLSKALSEGAQFAHVARLTRRRITVACAPRSARILRGLAEKYHFDCRVASLGGASALWARAKARATAAAAFGVALALSALYLSRVWIIDVRLIRGAEAPTGVEDALADSGVAVGASVLDIDTELAALRLNALEGCAHASVEREGVVIVAEIACEEPSPGLYDISCARDLVALCDGVITSVNVKSGTAMVRPGDTVRRGQVLIAGEERATKEATVSVGALGSVTARIWREGEAQDFIYALEKRYTGRESVSLRLSVPWYSHPMESGEEFTMHDAEISREYIGGLFVPMYIEREVRREYELNPTERDQQALRAALEEQALSAALAEAEENAPENAEIIDKWTDFSMIESDVLHARTVIELEAEIAVTRGYLEGY